MKRFNIVFAIMVALFSAGCYAQENTSKENIVAAEKANASQKMPFWCELLHRTYSKEESNICLSPLSAQMAIAMAAIGAEGETQQQMYNTIGNSINEDAKEIIARFNGKSRQCELNLANSIWINDKLSVKEEFINKNKSIYNAEVNTIPFDRKAKGKINNWCKENTNGKINEIIDEINASDMMYLINALYLKAPWLTPFKTSLTAKKSFTTTKGKVVTVDMMKQTLKTSYYIDDVVQFVSLPFEDGFEMLFALPRYKKSVDEAILHLATQYKNCTDNMETYEVTLSVPKFKTEFSIYMRDILYAMGMKRAFGFEAQFGNISDTQLYIDNIIQKTYIGVDENGAEAAAVTAVTMRCGAFPRKEKQATMTLDRPFIYAIRDRKTDNILFVGTVGDPTKQ